MAGNLTADNSGNIYVDFDYNNIIVVDPNKTVDPTTNKISERLVDHENLVMYANLEAELLPRTKLAVGATGQDGIRTVSIAKINFLKPTKDNVLGTGYYDELTGKDAVNLRGVNQPREVGVIPKDGSKGYIVNTVTNPDNVIDNGLLGMTSINIRTSTSFIPSVSITLEDIQGKALFQLGNNSPYAAFFNLPYPAFYLTLKGYYGQAIRYQLNLLKFNSRFNSYSGNYSIELEFVGYKFNILNEVAMAHLLAAPHMYATTFDIQQSTEQGQTSGNASANATTGTVGQGTTNTNNVKTQIVTEKGYQKIVEVYSEYKAKKLIPQNFPELTLVQLMNKLENFEKLISQSYPPANLEPLTNIRNYKKTLQAFYGKVRVDNDSWFNTYMNPKPIVLTDNKFAYTFKKLNEEEKVTALSKLNDIILLQNGELSRNPTLGAPDGKFPIPNPISLNMIRRGVVQSQINWEATTQQQYGTLLPSGDDILKTIKNLGFDTVTQETDENGNPKKTQTIALFFFEGKAGEFFDATIYSMEADANKKLAEVEKELSADLARKIESQATGLGFSPTVRNIMAVIMASAEGFIRLLDDVHSTAWNVKYDPVRKAAILNNQSSVLGSDNVEFLPLAANAQQSNQGLTTAQIPVYPWPQFFVETPEDKKGRFQLKYIADPTVVNLTKGYLYDKWPEVEFVEEYMKGLTQKFNVPIAQPPTESDVDTNIMNYIPLEFPNTGIAYANKEEIKFFYEIWERQYVAGLYNGFVRVLNNNNLFDEINKYNLEVEASNIKTSLGISSPYLTLKLKNYDLNSANYPNTLYNISNAGTGKSYQDFIRDFFVTPYLKEQTEDSFGIYNINQIGRRPLYTAKSKALQLIVESTLNEPEIVDTYPFTNQEWCKLNLSYSAMSEGQMVHNTNKVLKVFPLATVIANFTGQTDYNTNRPVSNFYFKEIDNPTTTLTTQTLLEFYTKRETKIPTEGLLESFSPNPDYSGVTTSSILNTPYFVNSIIYGVQQEKANADYPYVTAAWLFLNSLPLASLRERYKTLNGTEITDLDYIASCLKKFGGIHKLPYAWILKFGSIWHRYKVYKETNQDILSPVWKNFEYVDNYDPITKSKTKLYTFDTPIPNTAGQVVANKIVLQSTSPEENKIITGFYPGLINSFCYFYNGKDLYSTYTDKEIQVSVANGLKVFNLNTSDIVGVLQNDVSTTVSPFSTLLPEVIESSFNSDNICVGEFVKTGYYVLPSFGSVINQAQSECIDGENRTSVNLTDNEALFNGSVRMLWAAPNYGYFENFTLKKPGPDSYMNLIEPTYINQAPFTILSASTYNRIEEVFSVFDSKILNKFEEEFLNFSKAAKNMVVPFQTVFIGQSLSDPEAIFSNFQAFFKTTMKVKPQDKNQSYENYLTSVIQEQIQNFTTNIENFLEYDKLFRFGNPSFYQRRIWNSYLENTVDPIQFEAYEKGSLPTAAGTTTLIQSRTRYPQEWLTLELEVGFSDIPALRYTSRGSYITDFFVDNNIKFTVDNIVLLAPIIKMYATYKLNNQSSASSSTFKRQLLTYVSNSENLGNQFLNDVLTRLRKDLPEQFEVPERAIQSVFEGQQSKVENYEVFKALNDKWIAGSDYKNKTLFEDMMFLDRASRNIGEIILLDIFDLKNVLSKNALNMEMSVYTFLSSILIKNNFVVMPLPAYVNFYNVQDVTSISRNRAESSLEFANNMWGTFLNVDYRNSGPKLIAFYSGKPSTYLDLPKGNFRFRDDAFEMRRASENPLLENLKDKKDYALSNRCVGFNVDIGTRNQNIFYSFQVGQESGKATSESIQTQLNIVNQANGTNTATQNVSLYNLYKQRSYECTIQCFGNALIQPTMYFNLRHVPMFNGPYMITDVSHTIGSGNFETTFKGIRQGIFDLPAIDNFLQSLNKNLLTKIEQIVTTKKENTNLPPVTDNQKAAQVVQSADNTLAAPNTCETQVLQRYKDLQFTATQGTQTNKNKQELADAIKRLVPNNDILQFIIYNICYVRTFTKNNNGDDGAFKSFDNNFATITLDYDYGQAGDDYFARTYCCVNLGKTLSSKPNPLPVVGFSDLDRFILFMKSRLEGNIDRIRQIGGLVKYYVCFWPNSNVSTDYFDKNPTEFLGVTNSFIKAKQSAESVGLKDYDSGASSPNVTPTATATSSATPTPTPTPSAVANTVGDSCPPPVVVSFVPSSGIENTIIKVTGVNFKKLTNIKVNGSTILPDQASVNNEGTLITFTLPRPVPQPNSQVRTKIVIETQYGTGTSVSDFIYNPAQTNPGAPSSQVSSNQTQTSILSQSASNIALQTNNQLGATQPNPLVITTTTSNPSGLQILSGDISTETPTYLFRTQWKLMYQLTNVVGTLNQQGEKNITGYVTTNRKTFKITRDEIISELSNLLPTTTAGMKLIVKAEVFIEEPGNSTPYRGLIQGTIVY